MRAFRIAQLRIAQLAARKGVNSTVVENYLRDIGVDWCASDALANLHQESILHGWNHATVVAIQTGILEHFYEEE